MINAAVIGLGWWGREIIRRLGEGSDRFNFIRAVDITDDAKTFAAENDIPITQDYNKVLSDKKVDAVILATPHSKHEAQIILAAQAGKHVFCEKPLALTAKGASRAIEACNQAGVQLSLGHEFRFDPALREIKRMADDGDLGTILHVESNFSHDLLGNLAEGNWRRSGNEAPAAGMTSMGIHLTDAYINMFGRVFDVFSQTAKIATDNEGGDIISVLARFDSGMTGYINCVMTTPLFIRFRVFGTEAWAEAHYTVRPEVAGAIQMTKCVKQDWQVETWELQSGNAVVDNLNAFADAVEGSGDNPFTDEEKLHNIEVFEAICRSAQAGGPVRL
ncbi:MAG: Gfo/Idh/MocA family oxidoreductase [Rhodospirillales bacterium]|nr:Gfo/Idh/MocA family oxidoreductase [Rhodospirillales bacterium]